MRKEKELLNDPQWLATETAVMKKRHYFLNGSEESLCGKFFNTSKRVKGDTISYCDECKKKLYKEVFKKDAPDTKIKTHIKLEA